MSDDGWLRTYLQDHATAAAAARSLLERSARCHGRAEVRACLEDILARMDEGQVALDATMRAVGAEPSRVKSPTARLGECSGRMKVSRSVTGRSPLPDIVEIESLTLALTAVALGWTTLVEVAAADPRLEEAAMREGLRRALDQRRRLEVLRLHCVRMVLG